MTERRTWPPVVELVPHEPPMLLVDELLDWTPKSARVRARIKAGGPFVVAGRLPAAICLEYMAQAIAVAQGMRARESGTSFELGVLLGTRELVLDVDSLAAGDVLEVAVVEEFGDGRLSRYACEVSRAAQRVAKGSLNVMATTPEQLRTST